MRSTGAIIFLLIYLVVNTEFHQVLKIPVLVSHYNEHHQQNRDIRFFDFIELHYLGNDVRDADYEKDQQLPFKNSHCIQSSISITTPPEKLSAPNIPLVALTQKNLTPPLSLAALSCCYSIWQPPKV